MNWFTGLLSFVIIWWLVFFTVLPWGVKPPQDPQPGHADSAPDRPMLWRKALITTAIALVVWGVVYYAIEHAWVSFRVTR